MTRRRIGIVGALVGALIMVWILVGRSPENLTDEEKRQRLDSMYKKCRAAFKDVPDLSPSEAAARAENGDLVLVDVREDHEREISRIPGSISLEDFEGDLEAYKGESVAFYCTIGYRSGLVAKDFRKQGVDAYNLEGSIIAWVHEDLPVVNDGGKTNRVHVYGRRWDLVPEDHEAVW